MPDGVLPSRLALLVKREVFRHVLVDLAQGQLPLLRALDGHGDERGVGVGRPDQLQQLLLGADGEPAQVRRAEPGRAAEERPLGAVGGRDEGRRVVRGGGPDPWPVQPQVGVRGGRVVLQAVPGSLRALLVLVVPVAIRGRGHQVRGLLARAFRGEGADGRGDVVLQMGLRVGRVHPSGPAEGSAGPVQVKRNKCQRGWRVRGLKG